MIAYARPEPAPRLAHKPNAPAGQTGRSSPHLLQFLIASLALALFTMSTNAADAPPPTDPVLKELEDQKKILAAQKALADAEKDKLKSDQDLAKQRVAPAQEAETAAEAERAKRDKELTDTLAKLKEMSTTLPSGGMTASKDLVATPVTTALALRAAEEVAKLVGDDIGPKLTGCTVIFVDKLPTPADSLQLRYWLHGARDLEQKFLDAQKEVKAVAWKNDAANPAAKSALVAATALAALPGAINGIAGLFRADYSEKVGDAPIDSTAMEALLIKKLLPQAKVVSSIDALHWASIGETKDLLVIRHLDELQRIHGKLTSAGGILTKKLEAEQAGSANHKDEVAAYKESLAKLRLRLEEIDEKLAGAPLDKKPNTENLKALLETRKKALQQAAPQNKEGLEKLQLRLDELEEKAILEEMTDRRALVGLKKVLEERRDKLEDPTKKDPAKIAEMKEKIREYSAQSALVTSLLAEVTAFIAETVKASTDGKLKILLLAREELMHRLCHDLSNSGVITDPAQPALPALVGVEKDKVRFVVIKVAQKPQSLVEKKTAWWRSFHATGLIGVEYRVGSPDGTVIAADLRWQGYAQRMPRPDEITKLNAKN